MQSRGRHKRFYRLAALSMITIGSAMLLYSLWGILAPREMCDVFGDPQTAVLSTRPPCADPMYELMPSSYGFIPILLSICLIAFGGAIFGMIIRL